MLRQHGKREATDTELQLDEYLFDTDGIWIRDKVGIYQLTYKDLLS